MSKILVRLVVMLGLAALIALGWLALSQTGLELPAPRGLTDSRLYAGGPLAALQSTWSRQISGSAERSRTLQFSFSHLWPGVTDNLAKMTAGAAALVAGWHIARRLYSRLAAGR